MRVKALQNIPRAPVATNVDTYVSEGASIGTLSPETSVEQGLESDLFLPQSSSENNYVSGESLQYWRRITASGTPVDRIIPTPSEPLEVDKDLLYYKSRLLSS